MTVTEIGTLARQLMDEHGLQHVPIRWDNSKRRMGGCAHIGEMVVYFTFSSVMMPLVSDAEVRDTILHEIAHAKCPGSGHGFVWKLAAIAVGARPEACKAVAIDAKLAGYKYIAPCNCGPHVHGYSRMPKTRRICRTCRVHLNFVRQY